MESGYMGVGAIIACIKKKKKKKSGEIRISTINTNHTTENAAVHVLAECCYTLRKI